MKTPSTHWVRARQVARTTSRGSDPSYTSPAGTVVRKENCAVGILAHDRVLALASGIARCPYGKPFIGKNVYKIYVSASPPHRWNVRVSAGAGCASAIFSFWPIAAVRRLGHC